MCMWAVCVYMISWFLWGYTEYIDDIFKKIYTLPLYETAGTLYVVYVEIFCYPYRHTYPL